MNFNSIRHIKLKLHFGAICLLGIWTLILMLFKSLISKFSPQIVELPPLGLMLIVVSSAGTFLLILISLGLLAILYFRIVFERKLKSLGNALLSTLAVVILCVTNIILAADAINPF